MVLSDIKNEFSINEIDLLQCGEQCCRVYDLMIEIMRTSPTPVEHAFRTFHCDPFAVNMFMTSTTYRKQLDFHDFNSISHDYMKLGKQNERRYFN